MYSSSTQPSAFQLLVKILASATCDMSRVGQNHTFLGLYGVYTVFLAGKSPYIRSYTCIYTVLANPRHETGSFVEALAAFSTIDKTYSCLKYAICQISNMLYGCAFAS
jgi:hypothetical protein